MACVRLQLLLLAVAAALVTAAIAIKPHVHPSVHRTLRRQSKVNIFVALRAASRAVFESVEETEFATRGDKITTLVNQLRAHAEKTQAPLNTLLAYELSVWDSSGTNDSAPPLYSHTKSFWISNQVYFKDATYELVERLSLLPSLLEVREEDIFELPVLFETGAASATNDTGIEWGVAKIQAPTVWEERGLTGHGVVVGVIDTGVRHTHGALRDSFRGDYGWFDPQHKTETPFDDFGHGTHVTGTITGAGGIGVAPGAQWIACKGCPLGICPESLLVSCAQFMTCPTDASGANRNCSKAPDVINNSWGGSPFNSGYLAMVALWRAAGIIPVAANGNAGSECVSSRAPGCYATVLSVGATSRFDRLANYSSRGPTLDGRVKPDLSAPGSHVRSCWNTSDDSFRFLSGTSMASPHVTGVVALLLSANASLTYDHITEALFASADAAITPLSTGASCGGIAPTTFPNNGVGYGRVNALRAVNRVLGASHR